MWGLYYGTHRSIVHLNGTCSGKPVVVLAMSLYCLLKLTYAAIGLLIHIVVRNL